jgi:hypothetical protein
VQVVLGSWPAGPFWWWLTAQRIVQGLVAADAENLFDLPEGVPGPA